MASNVDDVCLVPPPAFQSVKGKKRGGAKLVECPVCKAEGITTQLYNASNRCKRPECTYSRKEAKKAQDAVKAEINRQQGEVMRERYEHLMRYVNQLKADHDVIVMIMSKRDRACLAKVRPSDLWCYSSRPEYLTRYY